MADDALALSTELPEPIPAKVMESGNERKPRIRTAKRYAKVARHKAAWLLYYRDFGTMVAACEWTDVFETTPYKWMDKDPAFKARKEEIDEFHKRVRSDTLDNLTTKAVHVMDKAMDEIDDPQGDHRMAVDASKAHLKGRGNYSDKAQVDHTSGGKPVRFSTEIIVDHEVKGIEKGT